MSKSALSAAANLTSSGTVGVAPPASKRESCGWVIPARSASFAWVRPSSTRNHNRRLSELALAIVEGLEQIPSAAATSETAPARNRTSMPPNAWTCHRRTPRLPTRISQTQARAESW